MARLITIEEQTDRMLQEAALRNILDDFVQERQAADRTQQALLNIMEDFAGGQEESENNQNAVLNILEDFSAQNTASENNQLALLNILEDFTDQKKTSESTQNALINILEDFTEERETANRTQKAVLNILEDFDLEKSKVSEANKELLVANKELETFSYSISHDLRNPLRAINGFAEMFSLRYGKFLDADGLRLLKVISDNAYKMGGLINDLLDYARLGRAALVKTTVDMSELVGSIWNDLKKTYPNHAVLKAGEIYPAYADKKLMQQALTNLLANAVKYSSKKTNPLVQVESQIAKDELIYSVSDNGVGFDMEYADKLFTVFQRLHADDEFEGNGVGLAIVQRVISKHGGKVWARSVLNQSASFYFSLPLSSTDKLNLPNDGSNRQ